MKKGIKYLCQLCMPIVLQDTFAGLGSLQSALMCLHEPSTRLMLNFSLQTNRPRSPRPDWSPAGYLGRPCNIAVQSFGSLLVTTLA